MAITNGYCTLAQLKSALKIADEIDDPMLELSIESASRMIDAECDRAFYAAGTAVRYFIPSDDFNVLIDDATTITGVASDDDGTGQYATVWTSADYQKMPLNNVSFGMAWPTTSLHAIKDRTFTIAGREATVKVTGTWGWSAIPVAVTQACVLQAARLWKRADAPFAVAGFGEMGAVRVGKTDPDVAMLLRPFKKYATA